MFAREAGILKDVDSPSTFSIRDIVSRIQRNQSEFQAKFDRKMKQEQAYYEDKYGTQNGHGNENGI